MHRTPESKCRASAAAVLSAGVMLAPGLEAQGLSKTPLPSQKGVVEPKAGLVVKFGGNFLKWRSALNVVGMLNGSPVFKNAKGEYFQVEPNTGDLKFHSPESLGFLKIGTAPQRTTAGFIKWEYHKTEQKVSVLGVDAQGRVIQENSRGERFYLGAYGDMVFVK
jgi:hypothetical protein